MAASGGPCTAMPPRQPAWPSTTRTSGSSFQPISTPAGRPSPPTAATGRPAGVEQRGDRAGLPDRHHAGERGRAAVRRHAAIHQRGHLRRRGGVGRSGRPSRTSAAAESRTWTCRIRGSSDRATLACRAPRAATAAVDFEGTGRIPAPNASGQTDHRRPTSLAARPEVHASPRRARRPSRLHREAVNGARSSGRTLARRRAGGLGGPASACGPADGLLLSELRGQQRGLNDLVRAIESSGIEPAEVKSAIDRLVKAGLVEPVPARLAAP